MDIVSLEVTTRDLSKKPNQLRMANFIPVEYYGYGVKNKSLQVDYQIFRKLYKTAGTNTIIELNIDGKEKANVLVHDIDRDPVSDRITHVDFINVKMDEVIYTQIPLEFIGTAPAVKELGGVFTHRLTEVEIKCLPKDLIHKIQVNIEPLVDFHTFIKIKDLDIPSTITVLHDLEEVVASVVPIRIEEEEVAPVTEEAAAVTEGGGAEGQAAGVAVGGAATSGVGATAGVAEQGKK